MLERFNPLVDDIPSREAKTVAGLAIQTQAITMVAADLWDAPEETHERAFIEAVCAFVGIAAPITARR
jgi:hypothetical protein